MNIITIEYSFESGGVKQKNILLCGDKNYLKYVGVTLTSVVVNASDIDYCVHIFYDDIFPEDIIKFKQLSLKYKINIYLYKIGTKELSKLSVQGNKNSHISIATYFRIYALEYLSENTIINKVLYLDSDIMVKKDIEPLFLSGLDDSLALVIRDIAAERHSSRLMIKDYFNAGVMLINLRRWKSERCGIKAITMLYSRVFDYLDQDVLNIIMTNQTIFIDFKYNFQYSLSRLIDESKKPSLEKLSNDAAIVHFIGASKPWHSWVQNLDAVKQYNSIKEISYWKDNAIVAPDGIKKQTYKYWHKAARVAKKESLYKDMIKYYFIYFLRKMGIKRNIY